MTVGGYFSSMRVKTSVTLPSSLLKEIDCQLSNRSAFLERAARFYLAQAAKRVSKSKDCAILEKHFEQLNREAEDVLDYQALPSKWNERSIPGPQAGRTDPRKQGV